MPVHIDCRKNETELKGHYPALGSSIDPSLDIVIQLLEWMRRTGLHVRKDCPMRERPAARCSCPPLFPNTRCAQGGVTVVTDRPASRQQASDRIRWAVTQAGGDSHRFSGISARKGGISVAIDAGVDETILYLQSGHEKLCWRTRTCRSAHPAASLRRLIRLDCEWALGKLVCVQTALTALSAPFSVRQTSLGVAMVRILPIARPCMGW